MGQLRKKLKTAAPESNFDQALEQELLSAWFELSVLLNKGLGFVDNFNCVSVTVADTGGANTEFTVAHSLKRIPTGYLVIRRDKGGVIYDSGTTFTVANIYLKCSVANAAITVLIF